MIKLNPPAGASIAICQFCLRRRPFLWVHELPLTKTVYSLPSPARSYSTEMTCSPAKPFKPDKWLQMLLISELFVFPDWCRLITEWLLSSCGCDFGCRSQGRLEEVGRTELHSQNKHLFVWLAFLPLIQNTWNQSLIKNVFEALRTCVTRAPLVINWATCNCEQKMKLKSGLACYCG